MQALLPNLTSSPASPVPSSSGQVAGAAALPVDSQDAPAASDKAAGGAAAAPLAEAQADIHSDPKNRQASKAVADGPVDLADGAVLEGPVGQALAEATMETVLAVLRSSEDPGQQALQCPLAVELLL